jgi:hypothetical protein
MAMIVADMELRKPSTYTGLAETMVEGAVTDVSEGEIAKRFVATRNTLAHAYRKPSKNELESIVKDVLPSTKTLVGTLIKYAESNRLDPPSSPVDSASPAFEDHKVKLAYCLEAEPEEPPGQTATTTTPFYSGGTQACSTRLS